MSDLYFGTDLFSEFDRLQQQMARSMTSIIRVKPRVRGAGSSISGSVRASALAIGHEPLRAPSLANHRSHRRFVIRAPLRCCC